MNELPMDEARLLDLAALPATDPRRIEAEKDPRVRAWLLEFAAFARGGDATLPADEADAVAKAADAALAKARAESAPESAPEVIAMPRAARARGGLPRWALAAAALAVVAGAAVLVPRFRREAPTYRSATPDVHAVRVTTHAAVRDAAGRFVLRWERLAGADAYHVDVFSGLTLAASHDAAGADSLVLEPVDLPAGDVLLWRVVALRDGSPIANSPPRELER